ncbi:MAG: Ribosome maturation factor RimM [Clostridia bacterium 41_269]|nr:MAG: Ribosome maturation factor RimM [Clostridia bacterium 41_269]
MNPKKVIPEKIAVAKVINTHGIKGEVKAVPLSDFKDRYQQLKEVFIKEKNEYSPLNLEKVRWHKGNLLLKFKEISSINEAELLKGNYIFINRSDAVELPKDTYYIFEIVGLEVYDAENNVKLGIVTEVLQTGANDVYIIKDSSGRELLVPALKKVVVKVDLEKNRMLVKLPEGLLDQ